MLDDVTKKRINTLRQILVGKLPDPKAQVEQITNGLIYKFMNDMDEQSVSLGGKASYFSGKFEKYSWKNLMNSKTSGSDRLELYKDAIEKMYNNENLPELFREIFKNSFLPFKDPSTLNMFLKEINEFHYSHSEKLGDAFEYLLSFMGSQGDAGQFRTPRHIIDFIVEIVNPQKSETILDPACGTAGFLISSYKHILNQNTKKNLGDGLTASDRKKIGENLNGYDISPDMVKMSLVNMYLHKFTNPKINEYDTLSSEDRWNEYYDLVLANPPFFSPTGGITPHKRFGVKSTKAEVLFVDYINEHLKPNGRAGIIVPEGIIFQSGTAYTHLRKKLIENSLIAIVSLPSGVFQPYSNVKTSILILDKKLNKESEYVYYYEVNNDGYTLNANRTPINKNDLPNIISSFKNNFSKPNLKNFFEIKKKMILENINFTFNPKNYFQEELKSSYDIKKLSEVMEVKSSKRVLQSEWKNQGVPFYRGREITKLSEYGFVDNELFIEEKHYDKLEKQYGVPTAGDIVMTAIGTIGNCYIVKKSDKFYFKDASVLWLKKITNINPKYLKFILKGDGFFNQLDTGLGSTVDTLPINKLKDIKIPLPPIETQNQIVEELDTYQKIIDGCRQVIENYKPSIDIDPSWEMVELNSLCSIITKGSTPTTYGHKFQTYGINFVKVETISQNNEIDADKLSFVDEKCHNDFKRSQLEENDILISIAGYVGISAKVSKDHLPANTNQALSIIRLKDKNFTDFVLNFLQTKLVQTSLQKIKVGVAQSNLSLQQIKNIKIPKLDITEAKKISNVLSDKKKVISLNKQLIDEMNKKINSTIKNIWSN